MNQNPRMRPDLPNSTPSWDEKPQDHATAFFSGEEPNIGQVAQALAARGGGAVSVDLALDLVLNDYVEQAREVTGASGAAIALLRNGEMVCRATTGGSAPDLGVRVDTGSGLAGACWSTGQIQQCRDTETDGRVNAEACRRLGVRSMLIAPLADGGSVFGILQVFSAWPNAFGEREISTLQTLARRIAENKREVEASPAVAPGVEEEPEVAPAATPERVGVEEARSESSEPAAVWFDETEKPRGREIWPSVLIVLVICVEVLLGMVIGRHFAATGFTDRSQVVTPQAATVAPSGANANSAASSAAQPETPATSPDTPGPAADSVPASSASGTVNSAQPPSGGLVVTENGKVIYRSPSQSGGASRPASVHSGTRLIHRVQPEYPTEARAQKIQGPVVLDVVINGDGAVGNIDVVSGDRLLANAAVQAVKQWRYKPYFVNGHAVESETRITVKFTLPQS